MRFVDISLSVGSLKEKSRFFCPACRNEVDGFLPIGWSLLEKMNDHGYIFSIFQGETFDPIKYFCPRCRASDRSRLYALFFEQLFHTLPDDSVFKFIDFAPAAELRTFFRANRFIDYRTADLLAHGVDDRVDIMNMEMYETSSVDMFLCSHVLEHVEDDGRAMRELYRILKPAGIGVVMVPIALSLESTYEDPSITTEAGRWKHFGQNDHLRIYAKKDFVKQLKDSGFLLREYTAEDFGEDAFIRHGISKRSVLYVVSK
jgi:predicted SAM-dependent methyltransferase